MAVERAAGEHDVDRAVVAIPAHQRRTAAQHADRQAAAQRLAVGDEIGADAEIVLRAAAGEAKAGENVIEDQDDAVLGAGLSPPVATSRA